jgi:hypothetical protein
VEELRGEGSDSHGLDSGRFTSPRAAPIMVSEARLPTGAGFDESPTSLTRRASGSDGFGRAM